MSLIVPNKYAVEITVKYKGYDPGKNYDNFIQRKLSTQFNASTEMNKKPQMLNYD